MPVPCLVLTLSTTLGGFLQDGSPLAQREGGRKSRLARAAAGSHKGEALEREVLNTALDGMAELVYVCDPLSYELLYLNEEGRRLYGADAVGSHLCYEVLQGRDAPCPFCTNDKLTSDSFLEWEFTNPLLNRHYLLRDRLVQWEGRTARLEIAFDVTDRQRESDSFKFLAAAGAMTVECIEALEGERSFGAALDESLRILGAFLEADRSYIFEVDGDRMSNTHEWCGMGIVPQKQALQDMPLGLIDAWIERFEADDVVLIDNVEDLAAAGRLDEYEVLKAQDIVSLVAVPLKADGRFVGYLGVDNPHNGERLDIIEKPLVAYAGFVSARMQREAVQRRMAELTWNDPLTCAHSRAAFHRDFDRGSFERMGIVLADADRLAVTNRERGRAAGDELLRTMASCLCEVFGDAVYRIGDDEFCAVATGIDYARFAEQVKQAAQRFLDAGVPASLGPAWHELCTGSTGLLDLAGDRMRSAKRGRHRAVDLGVDLASDAAVSGLLRPGGAQEAVEANLLDIHLMPQASGSKGEIIGAEALIRYCDSERGMQALPASFVPALEDMGEIASIDFFALSRACETAARWQQEGRPAVPLAVNFSRRTIGEEGFVERVAALVESHGVDRSLIEIEITESAREENEALLRSVAEGLREKGFRVAIDDFGVDNANFQLFIQLEFDVLKIDKSLVWGLGTEERTMQVICSLVRLCDELGIESVAEGIETEEQYRALREAGCTRAQGYRIGRPQPIEEFERRFLGF